MEKAVVAELQSLETREGQLTAEIVVEAAKPTTSPLHSYFEWDNKKAGAAYRLDQARSLIRQVRVEVVIEETKYIVPRYIRDPNKSTSTSGYIDLEKITQSSENDRHATIVQEFAAAAGHLRRARTIALALGMHADEIGQILERVSQLRVNLEGKTVM